MVLFMIITLLFATVAGQNFKTNLTKVEDCPNPEPPYEKNRTVDSYTEMYTTEKGQTLLRGNVTIYGETSGLKAGLDVLVTKNGQTRRNYQLKDVKCTSFLVQMVTKLLHIDYDGDRCIAKKGTYEFDHFDVNQADHDFNLVLMRMYGSYLWIFKIVGERGTSVCKILHVRVTHQDKKKKL